MNYLNSGQLTEAVRHRPHSVILFDEIEKAHRDVLNVMLQLLDDGRVTDGKGQTVDFKNTIIIMTSNIGDSVIARESILGSDQMEREVAEELRRRFRPEFLNRIDEVIVFRQLNKMQLMEIVDIMLKEIYERLEAKNIELTVTDTFKKKLIEEGYNPSYGARPLRRAIGRLLEDNLAEIILTGSIQEGDSVIMNCDSRGNVIVYRHRNGCMTVCAR
ncbi:hypothetical protein CICLE_v10017899mg [Citrus x clementina]|uniref:Clp ATPase C-terminal domain-containing protein n=1 Tax=Citrus clementina TaxID=85681 RepID=V4TIH5_CITCL|nr:hypothetical protein CICLE_v10017899mg [Citrus x clementina]